MEIEKRSEVKMTGRAVRGEWKMPQATMDRVVEAGADLLESPDPRVQIAAARLFVEISKIQQKDDHKQLDLEREATRSQVNNLTYNQFNLTTEDIYGLMDRMGRNVIEHES